MWKELLLPLHTLPEPVTWRHHSLAVIATDVAASACMQSRLLLLRYPLAML
jgi:hypothetical protein